MEIETNEFEFKALNIVATSDWEQNEIDHETMWHRRSMLLLSFMVKLHCFEKKYIDRNVKL